MQNSTNQTPELPWDKRPITGGNLVVVFGVIFLFIFTIAALYVATRDDALATGENSPTSGEADEKVLEGKAIFDAQCVVCHSIGGGTIVGPDLQGVTDRRESEWLTRWIAEPDKKLAEGDPIAVQLLAENNNVPMPNLGLSPDQVESVLAFLADPSAAQADGGSTSTAGEPAFGENIVHHPADIPDPIGSREPETVRVALEAVEVVGQLADGATYSYFTFNGSVPGPMIRVRVGDTVELTLANSGDSHFPHSIDLHAVNGPGGGHKYTQTNPGEEKTFTFTALAPGLYVYHCATPSVPHHITNGMYGLILVEPEGGLPPVDREYYVMQGEIYTAEPFGATGALTFDPEKMSQEAPEYYVFNGSAGALTLDDNVLKANVGETVRIFFGVGGPNKTSSFHVIGEIFDRAFDFGSLTSPPLTDVQTISVPPGGAWMVEFQVDVPGTYLLVDHALSRLERGLVGYLVVEGEEQPEIIHDGPVP